MALVKIITGGYNSGKTTLASGTAEQLTAEGVHVAGYLSVSDNPEKTAYSMKDLQTGELIPSVSETVPDSGGDWVKYDFSRFFFSGKAFEWVSTLVDGILEQAERTDVEAVFFDELGRLELRGCGSLLPARKLLHNFNGTVYLVIREDYIEQLVSLLGIELDQVEILRPDYAQ